MILVLKIKNKLFKIRYLKRSEEVIEYLSQIHTETSLPCMIVIENLQSYIDENIYEQVINLNIF